MAYPTSITVYANTSGAESANTAGGVGLSPLLNLLQTDVTGLATKLGTGASTPATNKVLRSSSNGTSVWGAVDLTTDVTGVLPAANYETVNLTNKVTGVLPAANYETVNLTNKVTGVLPVANGGTGQSTMANLAIEVGKLLYPVGSYYINETNSTNPGTLLGFGTWTAIQDRFIMAKGSTYATAGATGGISTIDWSHNHSTDSQGSHGHAMSAAIMSGSLSDRIYSVASPGAPGHYHDIYGNGTHTHTANTNGTSSQSIINPYIVAHIWKRTA